MPRLFTDLRVSRFAVMWIVVVIPVFAGAVDIQLISQGRRVDLAAHLVPGKLVLVEFYADWCAPCRIVEPQVTRRAERNPDELAVRKVDVINWESPVARQFGIGVLPHLQLYGPTGDLIVEGDAARVLQELDSRLAGSVGRVARNRGRVVPWVLLLAVAAAGAVGAAAFRGRAKVVDRAISRAQPAVDLGHPVDHGNTPRIWLAVMDGKLEGPFSVEQLADFRDRRVLADDSKVRRRGDVQWQRLAAVVQRESRIRI